MEKYSIIDVPEIREMVLRHLDVETQDEAVFVSPAFHKTICGFVKDRLKLDMVIVDDIFQSMMLSSRRFRRITVGDYICSGITTAERIVTIVEKFKKHLKSFDVSSPYSCSEDFAFSLFKAISDVEELSFMAECDLSAFPAKFRNLKKLTASSSKVITGILKNTPDDSLEELNYKSWNRHLYLKDSFQEQFSRQTKIKRLSLPQSVCPNLVHLDLEKLSLYSDNDAEIANLLKAQPKLRHLCCNVIGIASFDELQKIQNLEVLSARFSEDVTGELKNLKELEVYYEGSVLSKVLFPNLVKLIINEVFLKSEHFEHLSRSATNLQHVEIRNPYISFVPAIIENFPALKTLHIEINSFDQVLSFPTPTRQNPNIEELTVRKYYRPTAVGSLFDVINACPNLKRLQISDVSVTEEKVTSLIQNHPHLTHFWIGAESKTPNHNILFSNEFLENCVQAFKNSQEFVYLMVGRLADRNDQRLKNLLVDDDDRVILKKVSVPEYGTCNLKAKKKMNPNFSDPFEKFHKKQLTGFFYPDFHK